jgi:molecular chaperone GrpE
MQDERDPQAAPPEEPDEAAGEPAGADGPAEAAPAGSLAEARGRAADFEDRWKRSAAEFQNYKRRTEQERGEWLRTANGALIVELLPVLDDLERALQHVPAEEDDSEWVKGTRLVERKFRQILERQGVTPIEAVGRPFDPALHEAVGGAGTVVAQEYQRGYTLHGRVLRPSIVVVGEPQAAETQA